MASSLILNVPHNRNSGGIPQVSWLEANEYRDWTTVESATHLPEMPRVQRIHPGAFKQTDGLMQTYVLMTKLSPETSKQVKKRAKLGRAWLEQVKETCPEVHFVSHYALLGRYDFLDIFEAPDEETAAKVSMISLSNGAFQAESLIAIPYKRFIELTEDL
jgi:uncharacterized protein with GYD domain